MKIAGSGERRPSQATRSRDDRYQQLVELAPDGIIVHESGRVTFANAAALRMVGAARSDQVVGHPIEAFLDPPYLKAVAQHLTGAVRPVEPTLPTRDELRRVDGTSLPVEVRAVAFMDRGRSSAHLVIRDISERLEVQVAAQQAADRLQEAQRMELVGALAGGVAHEVSNMMQVVLGATEFLMHDVRLPAPCLADVQLIARAAENAASVTRQLLAFGRRDLHRPEHVDLAVSLRAAEPVIRRLLTHGQRLVVETDVAPTVDVDPGQLQQALVNLALNAHDAMAVDGTLTMTVLDDTLLAGTPAAGGLVMPPGRYAIIRVHDNGTGMDAETQSRIFEPFFTTKSVGKGSGLGLAAAHGVLWQNGGYLTVASALGQGATFSVYLPIGRSDGIARPAAVHPDAAVPATASATILVVDDEPAVRTSVARALRNKGFLTLQASDGAEALEIVEREGPPQLVVTDLRMPGVGGTELARLLKVRWPALPVLFMSGYAVEEFTNRSVRGSGELLQKPFTAVALLAAVDAALLRSAVSV